MSRDANHLTYTYYSPSNGNKVSGPKCHKCMNKEYHNNELDDVSMVYIAALAGPIPVTVRSLVFCYGDEAPFTMQSIFENMVVMDCTSCCPKPNDADLNELLWPSLTPVIDIIDQSIGHNSAIEMCKRKHSADEGDVNSTLCSRQDTDLLSFPPKRIRLDEPVSEDVSILEQNIVKQHISAPCEVDSISTNVASVSSPLLSLLPKMIASESNTISMNYGQEKQLISDMVPASKATIGDESNRINHRANFEEALRIIAKIREYRGSSSLPLKIMPPQQPVSHEVSTLENLVEHASGSSEVQKISTDVVDNFKPSMPLLPKMGIASGSNTITSSSYQEEESSSGNSIPTSNPTFGAEDNHSVKSEAALNILSIMRNYTGLPSLTPKIVTLKEPVPEDDTILEKIPVECNCATSQFPTISTYVAANQPAVSLLSQMGIASGSNIISKNIYQQNKSMSGSVIPTNSVTFGAESDQALHSGKSEVVTNSSATDDFSISIIYDKFEQQRKVSRIDKVVDTPVAGAEKTPRSPRGGSHKESIADDGKSQICNFPFVFGRLPSEVNDVLSKSNITKKLAPIRNQFKLPVFLKMVETYFPKQDTFFCSYCKENQVARNSIAFINHFLSSRHIANVYREGFVFSESKDFQEFVKIYNDKGLEAEGDALKVQTETLREIPAFPFVMGTLAENSAISFRKIYNYVACLRNAGFLQGNFAKHIIEQNPELKSVTHCYHCGPLDTKDDPKNRYFSHFLSFRHISKAMHNNYGFARDWTTFVDLIRKYIRSSGRADRVINLDTSLKAAAMNGTYSNTYQKFKMLEKMAHSGRKR